MIDCADNIAAYLENPAVGLNNQSLDILQRGRWSMESTVVEVGVSSTDLPRNNNIIDMVQDAVTAALSRTGARNYTVVQLPTVYTNENGETSQQRTGEAGATEGAATGAVSDASGETTAATVIIEDVIETDDEAADGASDRSATPTPEAEAEGAVGGQPATAAETPSTSNGAANDAAAGGEGGNNSGPRRRTRPQVLAQVIQHYRGVQTRLAPFVDRYYEILQNDPTFEESVSQSTKIFMAFSDYSTTAVFQLQIHLSRTPLDARMHSASLTAFLRLSTTSHTPSMQFPI